MSAPGGGGGTGGTALGGESGAGVGQGSTWRDGGFGSGISISWNEATLPSVAADTGESKTPHLDELARSRRNDRPLVFYFYSSKMAEKKRAKLEERMFEGASLGYASRNVRFYRIDVETIDDPRVRALYAPRVPSLWTMTSTGKLLDRRLGAADSSRVWKLAHDAYHVEYQTCLGQRFETYAEVSEQLRERELALAEAMDEIESISARQQERASAALARKLVAIEDRADRLKDQIADLRSKKTDLLLPPQPAEQDD